MTTVDAVYACHPSLLVVPIDFEYIKKTQSLAATNKDVLLDKTIWGNVLVLMMAKTGATPQAENLRVID